MSGMKVGLSMLYCLGYPFSYMTEQLRKAEVLNIEVLDESHHTLNGRRVKIIREISRSRRLGLTVHAPFADVNIASPNYSFRRAVLKRLKRSMRLASQLCATFWVFHPGLKTGVSHFHPEQDWNINLKSIHELLEEANRNGLRITIENTPEPFPFILKSADDFARFYRDLGDVDLGLTLDIGHANVNRQIYEFIDRFSDRLVHIHASDNDGTFDSHLGIGEGSIDWIKVAESLRLAKYQGIIVMESEKKVEESVRRLSELFCYCP